jgi:hypothetical protein
MRAPTLAFITYSDSRKPYLADSGTAQRAQAYVSFVGRTADWPRSSSSRTLNAYASVSRGLSSRKSACSNIHHNHFRR